MLNLKVIIVIPTLNEEENLRRLLPQIFSIAREKPLNKYQLGIIIVDDNSSDKTRNVALKYKYNESDEVFPVNGIHLIHRSSKMGLGSAYKQGFIKALEMGADIILEMDADLSHQAKYLPDLIEAVADGSKNSGGHVSVGARYIKGADCGITGWPLKRKIISGTANFLATKIMGLPGTDCTSGYRAFRREVLLNENVNYHSLQSGYAFQPEMLFRVHMEGYKIVEVPIWFPERRIGSSKLTFKDIQTFLLTALKLGLKRIQKNKNTKKI